MDLAVDGVCIHSPKTKIYIHSPKTRLVCAIGCEKWTVQWKPTCHSKLCGRDIKGWMLDTIWRVSGSQKMPFQSYISDNRVIVGANCWRFTSSRIHEEAKFYDSYPWECQNIRRNRTFCLLSGQDACKLSCGITYVMFVKDDVTR